VPILHSGNLTNALNPENPESMGLFTPNTASEVTYTVSGGALNSTQSNPIIFTPKRNMRVKQKCKTDCRNLTYSIIQHVTRLTGTRNPVEIAFQLLFKPLLVPQLLEVSSYPGFFSFLWKLTADSRQTQQ